MCNETDARRLGDVCVLGLGRTGGAVASYLAGLDASRVSSVTLYGGASSYEGDATRELERAGVRVVCGTEDVEGRYDLAVASPGIPMDSAFFKSAEEHAREVIGEPEFAWRESPRDWVAITGTNGKTTTTLLATALLRCGGLDAEAVGNVGTAATGRVAERPAGRWFVCELSSFQLAGAHDFHPRVACLTNVTPDHLEWHGSMQAYAEAKERVFRNLTASDLAVVSLDDAWCLEAVRRLEARGLRVCGVTVHDDPSTPCAAFVRDGRLVVRLDDVEHDLMPFSEMALAGEHNVQNALVAASLALELGVEDDAVRAGLRAFAPLEHRIEPCGEIDGVSFVDDSKATNVDSVAKALTAFDAGHVVVLLGGHDKGTEVDDLVRSVARHCKAAVCYGEAGPRLASCLRAGATGSSLRVEEAPHMREAFELARTIAVDGDVVLLSPACSSFDEFRNYHERGVMFKGLVAEAGRG